MHEITYKSGNEELLDDIRELWLELNVHHTNVSTHFGERFKNFTFERRREILLEKAQDEDIHIDLVVDEHQGKSVGYCLSTVETDGDKCIGEIESLYLKPEYRDDGIGAEIMKRAVDWLDSRRVETKKLTVAYGNDRVYNLYERFGFYPRSVHFEYIP